MPPKKKTATGKKTSPKETSPKKPAAKAKQAKQASASATTKPQRWTEEDEILLAELWKSEPHLFDRGTRDNGNAEVREETIRGFCESLGRTGKLAHY